MLVTQHYLQLKYLDKDKESNLLSEYEKSNIWKPLVLFKNTNEKFTNIVDEKTYIQIEKCDNCSTDLSPVTMAENFQIYKGIDSQLIMQRYYRHIFTCK